MIFDSDVLIWFLRGDAAASRLIESEPSPSISIVSVMEVMQGARTKTELTVIQRFLREQDFHVLPINEAISYRAAALIESHAHASGLQIADSLIAATALEWGQVLVTANIRHFTRLPGLLLRTFRPAQ